MPNIIYKNTVKFNIFNKNCMKYYYFFYINLILATMGDIYNDS